MINQTDPQAAFPDEYQNGMTLRDYFAAKAMPWFLTALENEAIVEDPNLLRQFAAESAYRMADAMIKVREA